MDMGFGSLNRSRVTLQMKSIPNISITYTPPNTHLSKRKQGSRTRKTNQQGIEFKVFNIQLITYIKGYFTFV